MKISQFYKLFALLATLFLLATAFSVYRALSLHNEVVRSEQHRLRSITLAAELFQSIEDQTRLARSFVVTQDPLYEKSYYQTLAIRNGQQARPAHHNENSFLPGTPIAAGDTISLQALMHREGLAGNELALLRQAQASSNQIFLIEEQALFAAKGLYPDTHNNYIIIGTANQKFAVSTLYSAEYNAKKMRAMAPIHAFYAAIDTRTKTELSLLQTKLRSYIILSLILITITTIGVIGKLIHSIKTIFSPLEDLEAQVAYLAQGHYNKRCDIQSKNEIGALCKSFNIMAECIEGDITRINDMAVHDNLTGLPNRILLSTNLRTAMAIALREKKQLALMFLDLDKFKPVNDTYGHAVGDLLLQATAQRITARLRKSDTVARIGGDEFVVLLHSIQHSADALFVAESIRNSLNQPFNLDGVLLTISSSIGVAIYPDHGSNEIELTKNADSALYSAKSAGRDKIALFKPA